MKATAISAVEWPSLLAPLNAAQRRAVQHFCGPLLVVAGAGAGKTRTLTYRLAYLMTHYGVQPENILAVTFTNKAAREMRNRIEELLAQNGDSNFASRLWIGTFHGICARILRCEIHKYQDEQGRTWTSNFTIIDEDEAQSLMQKTIVQELGLDRVRFEPTRIRALISRLKNQGKSPSDYELEKPNPWGKRVAQIYNHYQQALARNNNLDFDDLLLVTVRILQRNRETLAYWHERFRHIAVDEYQDTNRVQYELVRLLTTGGREPQDTDWNNRSIFVVGDADQSIYGFRGADLSIIMNFQNDFGDRLPDEETRTMIKLEENYRSVANILEAANHLIQRNQERIDKILRPTRASGHKIGYTKRANERDEAHYVVRRLKSLYRENPEYSWGSFAILYRTNAQSRVFEEILVREKIPYRVVGSTRFYERREIKDIIGYLRVLVNPDDDVSLLRIINVPKRGIGKVTLERLVDLARMQNVSVWQVLKQGVVTNLTVQGFVNLVERWRAVLECKTVPEIIEGILEDSGYRRDLEAKGTEEAYDRLGNLKELVNAAVQYEEEGGDGGLEGFLVHTSLASGEEPQEAGADQVVLMTLHASKGLEFPVVFMVGLEQGLFPDFRSLKEPSALEEERRLCYVGMTRARERLFLSRASYRQQQDTSPSMFLQEIPRHLIEYDRF